MRLMPVIPGKIVEIMQATPTVKTLRLDLMGHQFTFHPGQWIDCYADIDGERQVAGYTLTSSPNTRGFVEISVKTGEHHVPRSSGAPPSDELLSLDEIEPIQRRNPLTPAHAFVPREKTRRRHRRIDE